MALGAIKPSTAEPVARTGAAVGLSASRRLWLLELVLVSGLVLVAALARLPYLLTIPAFSDELDEVQRGLAILEGQELPLTNHTTFIGALFNYLVAGAFALLGPHLEAPRALVLTTGALTVGACYLLGRQLGGRVGGLVAAGLLATSGTHILVNSHIALSSSTTPLFLALGLWLLGRAGQGEPGWLFGAGLLLGLALQTHPAVLAALAGGGLYLLLQARQLLSRRWLLLGAAGFALGYANMIVYNLASAFESVGAALAASADYRGGQVEQPPPYLTALGTLGLATARLLAGALERPLEPRALLDPVVLVYPLAALVGLGLAARRGLALWALVVALWLLLLPVFNWKYGNLVLSRWINPIAPLCYAGAGLVVACLWAKLRRPRARLAFGLLVTLLVLQPLLPLWQYYLQVSREGPTNAKLLRLAELLRTSRRPGESVVIDARLQSYGLEDGASASKALRYALTVWKVPIERIAVTEERLVETIAPGSTVLLATDRDRASGLRGDFELEPLEPIVSAPFTAYRIRAR